MASKLSVRIIAPCADSAGSPPYGRGCGCSPTNGARLPVPDVPGTGVPGTFLSRDDPKNRFHPDLIAHFE